MKRLFIFFGAIAISTPAFCQLSRLEDKETNKFKVKVGIKAGLVLVNMKISYNTGTMPGSGNSISRTGPMGGFFGRMQVTKNFIFQPELLLVGKGMKESSGYSYRTTLTYLELPLNFLYSSTLPRGSFYIGGGPATALYTGQNVFYSGYQSFKKFDFGLNALAVYELPIGFSINLHYTHGLANISRNKNSVPVARNRCFGLAIGYIF